MNQGVQGVVGALETKLLSGKSSTLRLGVDRHGHCVQDGGVWRSPFLVERLLVEMASRWPRGLASAFVVEPKWKLSCIFGETG